MARKHYERLCQALDEREWNYEKEEDKLLVHFGVSGDDIPMNMVIFIDQDREVVRLYSPMGFQVDEDKRIEMALASCTATYGLADGSFDFNMGDGNIIFRMSHSYRDSQLGVQFFHYMISCACATVDDYNDKFLAIANGVLSIGDFLNERLN